MKTNIETLFMSFRDNNPFSLSLLTITTQVEAFWFYCSHIAVGRVKIAKIEQFSVFSLHSSFPVISPRLGAMSDQQLSVRYSQLLQYIVMFQSYLSSIINCDCFYTKKGILISLPVLHSCPSPLCFVWIKCLKTAVLSVMERWNGIKSI